MINILVCDDDREIVDAIEIYLSQEGYGIYKAYDGVQALEILEKQDIQLLLIDVMMPRLDGIRTTLKIRETSSIPIIILSAKSEDADKILGLNIGADDYIKKPFNPLELLARVKSGGSILDCGGRGYLMFKCGSDSDNDFVVDSSIWTVCEEFYTKLSVSNIYVTKYNLSDFKQKLIYGCDEPGTSGDISLGDFSGGMHRYVSYLPEYNVDSLNGAKYRVIVEFERADGDGVKYMAYSTFEVIK